MKIRLIFLLIIMNIFNAFSQSPTGIRGGLNLSSNLEYGEGPILGWYLAGYLDLETYKLLSYKLELKCTRVGYKKNESTLVSLWYTSLPLLLDVKDISNPKVEFLIGVEPGLFIGGNDIPIKRMRSPKYIFDLNHSESAYKPIFQSKNFNIEGVIGFKINSKLDTYIFLNGGFLTGDIYLSASIGF